METVKTIEHLFKMYSTIYPDQKIDFASFCIEYSDYLKERHAE